MFLLKANSRVVESRRIPESSFYLLLDEAFLNEDLDQWHLRSENGVNKTKPCLLFLF